MTIGVIRGLFDGLGIGFGFVVLLAEEVEL